MKTGQLMSSTFRKGEGVQEREDLEVVTASWPQLKLAEGCCSQDHAGDSHSPATLPGACLVPAGCRAQGHWGGAPVLADQILCDKS
jgi:hypothetical protein